MDNSRVIRSNVVTKRNLREVQSDTLMYLSDYLMNSAGPMGSTTMITHENAFTTYTKDGKTILENIKFVDLIENSIVTEMVELASYVVKEVGDGTTSLVVMANEVFKQLCNTEFNTENFVPYKIVARFIEIANLIKDKIQSHGKYVTDPKTMYDIALISTNGNKEISSYIYQIYKEEGINTKINVLSSLSEETIIKKYDGLSLSYGYFHSSFINNTTDHSVHVRDAKVYAFKDYVDTPEMIAYFDTIIEHNLLLPIQEGRKDDIVPTVILCPMISRDLSGTIDSVTNIMNMVDSRYNANQKPPFLIVTDILDDNRYEDIVNMCGGKLICKYINAERQKHDIEAGLAPTLETIIDWCGDCEEVISNKDFTTFVNPYFMYEKNEDGSYVTDEDDNPVISNYYEGLIKNAEEDLASLINNAGKQTDILNAKLRLNNLKANRVDLLIGGIANTDKESTKHLTEDAVYNCMSASDHGYGWGANFEGYRAAIEVKNDLVEDDPIIDIIIRAYESLIQGLYATVFGSDAKKTLKESLEKGMPINLRTLEYDGSVLSSIKSDQVILDCISKIITIMFTSNQAIVTNPVYNVYNKPLK